MKELELKKTEVNKSNGKYLYTVVENEKVLCNRRTDRDYVACYVFQRHNGTFECPMYFGRMDLVGKGSSSWVAKNPDRAYGLAILK